MGRHRKVGAHKRMDISPLLLKSIYFSLPSPPFLLVVLTVGTDDEELGGGDGNGNTYLDGLTGG